MSLLKRTIFIAIVACLIPQSFAYAESNQPADGKTTIVGTMPGRGMTMDQVIQYFGKPDEKTGPVGNPPISRWAYEGFVVYFEHHYVIHALATDDTPK